MSNIRFLDQTAVSSFDAASGKIDILQTGSLVLSDAGSINFEGAAVQVVTSGSNGVTVNISSTASSADAITTASAVENRITFTKGDSSTFVITVDTGSGSSVDTGSFFTNATVSGTTLSFTQGNGNTLDVTLVSASYAITASHVDNAVYTGSVSSNVLTFTKGDGSTFDLTVDTGSGTNIDTSSFATTGSNTFTGSQFFTGSLIPEATSGENGIWDLGSVEKPWRDLYITTSSLNFVKDGEVVSILNGGPDFIQVGNIRISTGSLEIVNNNGDVVSTIAEAEYSGSEPVSGSILETGSLLVTGSVSNNVLTFTKGDGSTFDLTVDTGSGGGGSTDTGSLLTTASVSDATITFTKGNSDTFEITVDNVNTASFLEEFSIFDGDRLVSNTNFPSGIYNNNFGTSGSLSNFIEAVFFPNTAPTLTSVTFSIEEFEASSSIVGVVTASDAEGQTITFGTQSSYTDDIFRINSTSGEITANTLMTTSLNTDTSQGYSSSKFPITLTDTFGGVTNDDVFIRVLPNAAPVWREGGVGGNIITAATTSLSESSAAGSKAQYYFTDEEGDTIAIETGSLTSEFSDAFRLEISSSFVRLVQTTASLDYETYTSYSFALTASDQHYPSPDPDSIAYLPVLVSVVDNLAPTVDNQTLTGVNENSSALTSAGTISVNEPEGDVVTFVSFTLKSLALDGSPVATGSYSGTGQDDPTEDAFEVTSAGVVRRKNSVFINSDIINSYVYTVTVRDNFNNTTDDGDITIPIADDAAPSITDNWVNGPYIIESAVDGDAIRTNSNGYSGTQADFNSNQSVTWTVAPSSVISINGSGNLSLNTNLSGSLTGSGDSISASVTASNSFGTTNQTTFTIQVTENQAPTATFNANISLLTSSLAVSGSTIASLTGSDPQGLDNIISASIFGDDANKFELHAVNSAATTRRYSVQPTSSLEVGTYSISGSVFDAFGKSSSANLDFNIVEYPSIPDVFIYSSTRGQSAPIPANYSGLLGNGTTSGTPIFEWASGSLGNEGPITLSGGVMTLIGSASSGLDNNNLAHIVSASIGSVNPSENEAGNHLIYIVYPSSSDLPGRPSSMTDSFGGSTAGEYVLYYFTDAVDKGIVGSQLDNFTISTGYTSSDGTISTDYTDWTVLGCNNSKFSSTSTTFYVVSSSGSAPA